MFPALCARSMAARLCLYRGRVPAVGTLCCSNRSCSHGLKSAPLMRSENSKLSWNAVDGIMTRAVKRGLSRIKSLYQCVI